ncbi:response regulator [Thalassotalea euphylliae]|uniref:Sensory/regulatory protein RpfC n=1 Tax=Thalassotalea euphylliae TaxID=1655234 RepID=A0A3E0TLC2_9GAMM|nr:response regulator [Thalassotalea euphylliae]REL25359.1 response regulator [Thalassotalea euphylliae]
MTKLSALTAVKNSPDYFKFSVLTLAFCLLACLTSLPLAAEQKIQSLSLRDGLTNPQVYDVVKDAQGFIWFGTADGVKRFDGYGYTSFKHQRQQPSSLSNNNISVMLTDRQDRLWVGTWGGGINLYQPASQDFVHFRHDPLVPSSIASDKIQAIHESKSGAIWFGTNGGGLNLFDSKAGHFTRFTNDPDNPASLGHNRVWSIQEDADSNIWVGTSDGLYKKLGDSPAFKKFGTGPQGLDHPEVRALYINGKGQIWLATRKSFGRFYPSSNRYEAFAFPSGAIPSITKITPYQDALLLATFAGIYRFNILSNQFEPASSKGDWALLHNRDIRQVMVDDNELLWAATRYSGVKKIHLQPPNFDGWTNFLPEQMLAGLFSQVHSIAPKPDGALWLGTGRSIVHFDGKGAFIPNLPQASLDSLLRLRVNTLKYDNIGGLYLGTNFGIFYLAESATSPVEVELAWAGENSNTLELLDYDQQGWLWLDQVKDRNVVRWNPATDQLQYFLQDVDAEFTFVDSQGHAWVGTNGEGLFWIDPNSGETKNYSPNSQPSALSDFIVNSALQTDKNTLWVATNRGLDKLSLDTGLIEHISLDIEDVGFAVFSIVADQQGILWLATAKGIYRLNPDTKAFHFYTINDGLHSNNFLPRSAALASNGHVYFGSIDGLTGFDPSKIQTDEFVAPLAITRVEVDGVNVFPIPSTLKLPHHYKQLTITFASLDYRASEDNQYRTRLTGYLDEWTGISQEQSVSYARMEPDTYVFEVIGSNKHGIWNPVAQQLTIEVVPAWYQTLWFKTLAPLLILLLVLGIYVNRLREHKRTEEYLSKQVDRKANDIFVLGDVGKDIASTTDMDELGKLLFKRLDSSLHAQTFALGLYRPETKRVELIFSLIRGRRRHHITLDAAKPNKPISWTIHHQREFIASTDSEWRNFDMAPRDSLNGENTQTVVCQPLMSGNTLVGVLTVQSDETQAFDPSQINILRIVSSFAAVAVSNMLSFQELAKAEERMDMAMQAANVGTWEWQPDTGEMITNDVWATMIGHERDNLVAEYGAHVNQLQYLVHPDDLKPGLNKLNNHLLTNADFRHELRMKTAEGDWKWILSTGKAMPNKHDSSSFKVFGVHIDISDVKVMEAALTEAKNNAESTAQAKSDFLSNMSHEIRTPMNAIIGMSHLALQTELTSKQQNYIDKVHQSANSLLGIINDILDFSKIEAGRLEIEKINFYLDDVLNNLINVIGFKAAEKAVDLYFDIAPDAPTALTGDPLRIGQILLNLVGNAIKFSDQGGEVIIKVSALSIADEQCQLQFCISDNGIGMTTEQQQNLFQSFSQADSSITRKYGGTGLGLAICKDLTALMGGEIWVESEQNCGSHFFFTLQLGVQAQQASEFIPTNISELNILVVDDSDSARSTISGQLASLKLAHATVATGVLAVDYLTLHNQTSVNNKKPIDLVLMDWQMPDMDGLETIAAIRASDIISRQPKIIMLTCFGQEPQQTTFNQFGISASLAKPITPSNLYEAIVAATQVNSTKQQLVYKAPAKQESLAGAKLLLVEDNKMNQELACELLANADIEVVVADNGQIAVDLVKSQYFDGVLMDCQMPIMDGYTATAEIRALSEFADLPIIALTANVMASDLERVKACGMNAHIGKPINVGQMFNTLARWITPASPQLTSQISKVDLAAKDESLPFNQLDGINVNTGLAATNNSVSLYKKQLLRFLSSYQDFATIFNEALSQSDIDSAAREAHTLKGIAGTIGAYQLYQEAAELEQLCRESAPLDDALTRLLAELDLVLTSIDSVREHLVPAEQQQGGDVDTSLVKDQIAGLIARLEDYDINATEILTKLTPALSNHEVSDTFTQIQKAMDEYDFDSATEHAYQLQQKVGELC